jgi:hypothetical protein
LQKIGKYVCKNLATRLEKCSKKFAIIGKSVCEKLAKCPWKIGKNVREKIGKNVRDKLAKMFAKNLQIVRKKSAKRSARSRQNVRKKIGKIVREKSAKMSAKIHTNLQIYPCKITRENVLNLHKIIVCKIIFESKQCCLLKEKYTYSWPSLSDDRLSCLTTPAEYVYISEAESDLMISK